MDADLIFIPILLQIVLVIWLYLILGSRKKNAAASGQVDESRRNLHADAWPDSVVQVNNAIRNQFELPVLFYVTCFMLWALLQVNAFTLVVALAFVASRLVHAIIHIGSNYVPRRRMAFALGCFLLVVLDGVIAYRLLLQLLY